jgi:hypothetical protein
MLGRVACRSPKVEWDEAGSPCDLAGGPDLEAWEQEGLRSDTSWIPEGGFSDEGEALSACLSSQISPFSERNGLIYRIKGVEVFENDVVIRRTVEKVPVAPFDEAVGLVMPEGSGWVNPKQRGDRKALTHLSHKSLLALCHKLRNCGVKFRSLLTLTYPERFTNDGRIVKRHLDRFIKCFRRKYGSGSYAWFLEFQDRGAPHFHMLTTVEGVEVDREWLGRVWSRIVDGGEKCRRVHAHVKQWEVIKKEDGAVRYVAKYAKKQKQKEVPMSYQNVGRFWGTSPDVKAAPLEEIEMDAKEILSRMGLDSAKFVKQWGRGSLDLRRYLWDQAGKFRTKNDRS